MLVSTAALMLSMLVISTTSRSNANARQIFGGLLLTLVLPVVGEIAENLAPAVLLGCLVGLCGLQILLARMNGAVRQKSSERALLDFAGD